MIPIFIDSDTPTPVWGVVLAVVIGVVLVAAVVYDEWKNP